MRAARSKKQAPLLAKRAEQFACLECDKAFRRKWELMRHGRTHMESTLTCGVCGSTFAGDRKSSLERHQVGNAKCLELQRALTDEELSRKGCVTRTARLARPVPKK